MNVKNCNEDKQFESKPNPIIYEFRKVFFKNPKKFQFFFNKNKYF